MYTKIQSVTNKVGITISLQCPHCGHFGTFQGLSQDIGLQHAPNYSFGQRKCPRPQCSGHIFFICDLGKNVIRTYPSQIISFNKENIPERIINAISEAITCHAEECFIASAIMVRKTLEEICEDRGAEGPNLYQRLQDLSTKIVIPSELVEAMNELRLLGNDAAHIEARTFEEIGTNEIEISIEFTKEILKAIYQYESLLGKLRSLKRDE